MARDPRFRHWRHGRFDEASAGRAAIPSLDDAGVWRDYFTGAPCDAPATVRADSVQVGDRIPNRDAQRLPAGARAPFTWLTVTQVTVEPTRVVLATRAWSRTVHPAEGVAVRRAP